MDEKSEQFITTKANKFYEHAAYKTIFGELFHLREAMPEILEQLNFRNNFEQFRTIKYAGDFR